MRRFFCAHIACFYEKIAGEKTDIGNIPPHFGKVAAGKIFMLT